nr:retrovirus-related Pol polyprotein from transposon TNT 1-94 [Tanacetum cinerariifolium]
MSNILANEMIGLSFPPTTESKKSTIDSSFDTLDVMSNEVGKVKVLRVLKMIEHDSGACIYGALVRVDTNEIFSNNEFPILDVGRKIISKDNGKETIKLNGFELINDVVAKGERGFNMSSFMNEAISKSFEGAFGIVWSRPLVMEFWVISLRRGIKPRNPQHVTKGCETCGSTVHTTTDHNDIEWFRRAKYFKIRKIKHSNPIRLNHQMLTNQRLHLKDTHLFPKPSESSTPEDNKLKKHIISYLMKAPLQSNSQNLHMTTSPLLNLKDTHLMNMFIHVNPVKGAGMLTKAMAKELSVASAHECLFVDSLSEDESKKVSKALKHPGWVDAMHEELNQFARNMVWILVPAPYGKTIIGSKWVFRNKRDETGIVIKKKSRLVA